MSRRPSILTAVIAAVVAPAGSAARLAPRRGSRGQASGAAPSSRPGPRQPTERAFSISRKDGNDTRGPLDLASMKITRGKKQGHHRPSRRSGRVSNAAIDPINGNLADPDRHQRQPAVTTTPSTCSSRAASSAACSCNLRHRATPSTARSPTSRTGPRGVPPGDHNGAKIKARAPTASRCSRVYQGVAHARRSTCLHRRDPEPVPADPARPPGADVRHGTTGRRYSGDASDEPHRLRSSSTSPTTSSAPASRSGPCSGREVGGHRWETVGNGKTLNPTVDVPGEEGKHLRRSCHRDRQAEEPEGHRRPSAPPSRSTTDDGRDLLRRARARRATTGCVPGARRSYAVTPGGDRDVHLRPARRCAVMGGTTAHRDGDVDVDGGGHRPADRPRDTTVGRCTSPSRASTCQRRITHRWSITGTAPSTVLDRRVLRGAVTQTSVRLAGSLSPASQRAITNNRSLRRLR